MPISVPSKDSQPRKASISSFIAYAEEVRMGKGNAQRSKRKVYGHKVPNTFSTSILRSIGRSKLIK